METFETGRTEDGMIWAVPWTPGLGVSLERERGRGMDELKI